MKKGLVITAFMIIVFISSSVLFGNTLEERLSKFAGDNGKNYMKPFITAFGTNLNTGWFQTAKVTKPFRFGFTLSTALAFVPEEDMKFMASNPDTNLYIGNEVESATIFGNDGGYFDSKVTGIDALMLPKGIDLNIVPFVFPQVFVGLPGGFEIIGRYFPPVELSKDIGEISFWGLGLKYQVSKLIPLCPVAISLQGVYQQFKLEDIITANCTFFNAQLSKGLVVVPITLYGGIGIENTTVTAKYEYTGGINNTNEVKFDITVENEFRVILGMRYKLLILDICADYSFGKYSVARLGLGFSL
ncbi:MAG: hypothetical protein KAW87_03960 [Candidatus Cloacimonetes bacterium]|nr:hypothetical protein [Candidatus Cloacimonadota bacterium]